MESRPNGSKQVSIICVNWNSTQYLRESIRSIYELTHDVSFEIIVVDNASPCRDVEALKGEFPGVTLIKSEKNLGFAGANNLGFVHSSGRQILFLNPDTKLTSPAINVMSKHLDDVTDSGIAGCRLLNMDLSVQTSCIQTFPTILNQVLDIDYLRNLWPHSKLWGISPLYSEPSKPVPVEVVSGACLMIKREVFEKVGRFSSEYFMYAEDLDLCYKVAKAGYGNYYCGEATVVHYGGKSSVPRSATVMKWTSILMFCRKTRGPFYGFAFRIAMSVAALMRLSTIAVMSLFGHAFETTGPGYSVFGKWGTILRTLLTPLSNE